MPQFTLTINLSNDAMSTPEDISRALIIAAKNVQDTYLQDLECKWTVKDSNGNTVGFYRVI